MIFRIGHLNMENAGTRPLSEAKYVRDTTVLPSVRRLEGVLLILLLYLLPEGPFPWYTIPLPLLLCPTLSLPSISHHFTYLKNNKKKAMRGSNLYVVLSTFNQASLYYFFFYLQL